MRSKKDFTVIEISLIFGIFVSECPSIQQFHEPKDNQLTLEYGFKINQTATIPFVNVYRQELILEMENGTGENKLFSLIWNNTSLNEKKSLDIKHSEELKCAPEKTAFLCGLKRKTTLNMQHNTV